jgi:hypothetical protein
VKLLRAAVAPTAQPAEVQQALSELALRTVKGHSLTLWVGERREDRQRVRVLESLRFPLLTPNVDRVCRVFGAIGDGVLRVDLGRLVLSRFPQDRQEVASVDDRHHPRWLDEGSLATAAEFVAADVNAPHLRWN